MRDELVLFKASSGPFDFFQSSMLFSFYRFSSVLSSLLLSRTVCPTFVNMHSLLKYTNR